MTPDEIKAMLADFSASLKAELTPLREDISTLKIKVNAPPPAPPPAPEPPAPPPPPEPAPMKNLTPEDNATILEMRRQAAQTAKEVSDLKAANEQARKEASAARKDSAVNAALADIKFAPGARDVAFSMFGSEIREEGGRYIAGDNLTPDAHAKQFFTERHSYLLAANGSTGGTGVTSTSTNPQGGGRIATTEMIKYGMSEEDKTLVRAQIAAVAKQQLS